MATKKATVKPSAPRSLAKPYSWILAVGGSAGLISSFILTLDKIEKLKNPSFQPNCDINPIVSCGDVLSSSQGSVFGFPNSLIGMAMFAALAAIGIALLAGAKFRRWFWLGLWGGMVVGIVFAFWMLEQSIYSINALCPYCLSVDVATITIFWYSTLYLLETKILVVPKSWNTAVSFVRKHHLDFLIGIFLIIIAVILKHFWYYYGQKL
jgi:uncharacterized membrane protein